MWIIREYVNRRGKQEIGEWFEQLNETDQAFVLVAIENLARVERDFWKRSAGFDTLHGLNGMGEIILGKIAGVQTRLIGFFGPGRQRHVFTVVLVVTKKMREFRPKGWVKTAQIRKAECEKYEERSNAWYP